MADSQESGPGNRSLWRRLRDGLSRTQERLSERLGDALDLKPKLDATSVAELEEALIAADLGVETVELLMARLKERVSRSDAGREGRLRELLKEEIERVLREGAAAGGSLASAVSPAGPRVTLVVGVNGAGKTTSIAKLARRSQAAGQSVLLAAGDTFRAAASEQLALWGERLGIPVVRQAAGADPAAVVFDALQSAKARHVDHLIVDTAGRLHTKEHLMNELAKIRRVIDREAQGWSVRTLLVLDATTGQNALVQAREFLRLATVDGILLAKLDGTAKGGIVVAVVRELGIPVLHLGVGEKADDLVDFDAGEFAAALVA